MFYLDKLEQQMREQLSSDVRLMNDLQATRRLAELKKQFDETQEKWVVCVCVGEGGERESNGLYRSCCLIAQAAELIHDHSQINSGSCLCGSVM